MTASDRTGLGGFVGGSNSSSFEDCDLTTTVDATGPWQVGGFEGWLYKFSVADCDVSDATLSVSGCVETGNFAGEVRDSDIASCTFDGKLIIVPVGDYDRDVAGFVAWASADSRNSHVSNRTVRSGFSITLTSNPTRQHYVSGLIAKGKGSNEEIKLIVKNNYVRISLSPSTPAYTQRVPLIAQHNDYVVFEQNDAEWEQQP